MQAAGFFVVYGRPKDIAAHSFRQIICLLTAKKISVSSRGEKQNRAPQRYAICVQLQAAGGPEGSRFSAEKPVAALGVHRTPIHSRSHRLPLCLYKKLSTDQSQCLIFGGPEGSRTLDLRDANAALSRTVRKADPF